MRELHLFPASIAVAVYHDGRPCLVVDPDTDDQVFIVLTRETSAQVGRAMQDAGSSVIVPKLDGRNGP